MTLDHMCEKADEQIHLVGQSLLTITVEQSKHHIADVVRQLHLGHSASHLLHGS